MKKIALEYLKKDSVLYMGMIFPIKRGTADIIYAGQDGVYIRETESNVYMITSENFNKSKGLIDKIGKQNHICVYQKDIADYLYKKYDYKKYVENVQAVYLKSEHVKVSSLALDIHSLNLAHLNLIHEHFAHLDYDYIKKRLECGAIFGGSSSGEFCGFIGIHTEGSMGILKVLEKFQGRGFALELGCFMVNSLLDRGEIPFSQIEFDNEASIGLHKKLGFEISSDTLYRLID